MDMKKIGLYIVKLIAAGLLVQPVLGKLTGNPGVVAGFTALGMEPTGRILIGILEALVIVLLLIPRFSASGAFLGMGIMCGAIIAHVTDFGMVGASAVMFGKALLIFASCAIVAYVEREDLPLIGRTL